MAAKMSKPEFVITSRDSRGVLFYLLAPRGAWTTWGAKAKAQRFPSKTEAAKTAAALGQNRDPRERVEIAKL
jgi:hypothetical protein